MNYKIYPVYLGETKMQHNQAFYGEYGEIVHLHYGLFVLKDEEGNIILVDSGRPTTKDIQEKGYPYKVSEDAPDLLEALREKGVEAEKVKYIILTHLHYDHAWNLEKFPNAVIFAQIEEIRSAVMPCRYERQPYGILKSTIDSIWIHEIRRFRPVYGDEDILPGIRVITTPPHTAGSQSVIVDTAEGKYILVGDWTYSQENIERAHPLGAILDTSQWYDSLRKILKTGAVVLSTHDNAVLNREVYG